MRLHLAAADRARDSQIYSLCSSSGPASQRYKPTRRDSNLLRDDDPEQSNITTVHMTPGEIPGPGARRGGAKAALTT